MRNAQSKYEYCLAAGGTLLMCTNIDKAYIVFVCVIAGNVLIVIVVSAFVEYQ
jgi:hypothetical protein